MAKKTLASVRSGIGYQDLIAAESLLAMIDSTEPPTAVTLEDRRGGKFDDVVEWYPTRTIWKQVKWSEHPATEPFTLKGMAEPSPNRKTSLLAGFAESYNKLKAMAGKFELHLVSNRTVAPALQSYLKGEPPQFRSNLTKKQTRSLERAWLKETKLARPDFVRLIRALRLQVGSSDLVERERSVRARLRALGLPDVYEQFMAAIARWASDPQFDRLTAEDVRNALGPLADYPDNRFALRRETLVIRANVHNKLLQLIDSHATGYLAVLSPPGTGKSTVLNTLRDSPTVSGREVIVYNCFTGVGDAFLIKRASAENFAIFLAKQLYQHLGLSWGRRVSAGTADIESMLSAASARLSGGSKLVLAIDGLDHAQRNKPTHAPGLIDVLPPELPPGVVIIVSAQAEEQLPEHLRTLDPARRFSLPALTEVETERLLERHGVFDGWAKSPLDRRDLRRAVHLLSKGHPLHSTYVARAVAERVAGETLTSRQLVRFVRGLDAYDHDIRAYYSKLFPSPSALARRLIGVLSAAPFPLTPEEAASLIPSSPNAISSEDAIAPYAILFERRDDQLAFAHDSLRAYARDKGWNPLSDERPLVTFLRNRSGDPRHGEYLPSLLVQANEQAWALANINCVWLARQLALGCRPALLQEGMEALAADAAERKDWPAMARWSLLRERLDNAVSFELDTLPLFEAWLGAGLIDRLRRRAFDGQLLGLQWSSALDLAGIVESKDRALALRLRAAVAEEPFHDPGDRAPARTDDAVKYVRNLALHWTPAEVLAFIEDFAEHQTTTLRQTVADRKRLRQYLAAAAAYACFFARDGRRLQQWLAVQPSPLRREHADMLKVYLAVRQQTIGRPTAALKRIVESDANWGFLSALSKAHGKIVVNAVTRRTLPAVLKADRYAWFETDKREADLDDLFEDVRFSVQHSLRGRVTAIEGAINTLEPHSHGPLCRIVFVLAKADAERANDWEQVAAVCLAHLTKMDYHAAGMNQSGPVEHFMRRAGEVLLPLANLVDAAGRGPAWGTFVEQQLLPALRRVGMYYWIAHESVLTHLLRAQDDVEVYRNQLELLETHWRDAYEHKSAAFLRVSRLWGPIDRNRAMEALEAGTRAAFTYGYHKDVTINAAIEAVAVEARDLEAELTEAAAQLCIALGVVDAVTDHDHVMDNAASLVAAVAMADVPLATRIAAALKARLSKFMWRTSIAQAVAGAGLDLEAIREEFYRLTPALPFGHPVQERSPEAKPSFAELFQKVLAGGTETGGDGYGDRERLDHQVITTAPGRAELEQAAEALLRTDSPKHELLARLAQRASELNEPALAFEFAERSVTTVAEPFLYSYWHTGATRALVLICRLNPSKARRRFEEVVQDAVIGEYGIGFASVPILCECLTGLGDKQSAKAVLWALLQHLNEITAVYPREEAAWRKMLSLPVSETTLPKGS